MPGMTPRLVGVIEWHHAGRHVPCYHYDADTDEWTENEENLFAAGETPARYVTLVEDGDDWSLGYLAARTAPSSAAGIDTTGIGWIDVQPLRVLGASGLSLDPGWQIQPGCPEPITMPPSGHHWDHPRVCFRFLGRLYATLAHGVFAVPSMSTGVPDTPPLDMPIRMGRLLLLPDGCHVLP